MSGEVGTIADVRVATARVPMPVPARVGEHVIAEREYALVRVVDADGREGFAYGLTRGAPLEAMARGLVAPRYVGRSPDDPAALADAALRSNPTVLCAGSGLRALSLVDMACWDLLARAGGGIAGARPRRRRRRRPARAAGGRLPAVRPGRRRRVRDPGDVRGRLAHLQAGPGRGPPAHASAVGGSRGRGPDVRLVLDAAWTWRDADDAMAWVDELGHLPFAWIEDPFPPGRADELAALRARMPMPLGAGDEVGGPFFPEAMLERASVDVLRLDATAVGGVSGLRAALRLAVRAGTTISCHVHGLLHGQVLRGLGVTGWVEFGRPGSGVDPLGDALLPDVEEGDVRAGALATAEPPLTAERLQSVACAEVDAVLRALDVHA